MIACGKRGNAKRSRNLGIGLAGRNDHQHLILAFSQSIQVCVIVHAGSTAFIGWEACVWKEKSKLGVEYSECLSHRYLTARQNERVSIA